MWEIEMPIDQKMFGSTRVGFLLMWPMTKEQHFNHSSQIWMYLSWKSLLITRCNLLPVHPSAYIIVVLFFWSVNFCPPEVWPLNSRPILFMLRKGVQVVSIATRDPPCVFLQRMHSFGSKKGEKILQIKLRKSPKYKLWKPLARLWGIRLYALSKMRRIKSSHQ